MDSEKSPEMTAASTRGSTNGGNAAGTSERYCAFCGLSINAEEPAIERFGEPLCSEDHAAGFVKGVRAARAQAAVAAAEAEGQSGRAHPSFTWGAKLKKSLCWGAPVLLLLALPLLNSSDALAKTGGSLLSVLALLACPLGMFFMMRAMGKMAHTKKDGADRHGS